MVITGLVVAGMLVGCGGVNGVDIANAYMVSSTPDEALALFAENAVRVDVTGTEYVGRERIRQQLTLAFSQRDRGETLEPAHVDGDHVTWVAVSYDRISAQQYRVRSNIWVDQGKIVRYTSSFAL